MAPFRILDDRILGDRIPDDIHAEIGRSISPDLITKLTSPAGGCSMGTAASSMSVVRRAGKVLAFGDMYGTPGGDVNFGKRWKCARCQRAHYSEEEPSPTPMLEVRVKEEDGAWSMPFVPCKYSHMPTYRLQPFGTCDEEMVRWVMES